MFELTLVADLFTLKSSISVAFQAALQIFSSKVNDQPCCRYLGFNELIQ